MLNLSEITVIILAGGLGTRLQSVTRGQKVVAKIKFKPFLGHLLNKLNTAGFKNVVLCTGHLGEQVRSKLGEKYKDIKITYSKEDFPLGTAGALRLALPYLKSQNILVTNGDTYCNVDLEKFVKFHFDKKANASLVTPFVLDTSRYGSLNLDPDDAILAFEEKNTKSGEGWINGGIYLINRSLISEIEEKKNISLEKEIFPKWIGQNFYAYKSRDEFIDIGTPESYAQAEDFFEKLQSKKRFVLLDRDGTLVVHYHHLSHPDQIELIPGAVEALKEFKRLGLGVVVITNQSVVGRGHISLKTLDKIHQRLIDLLLKEGIVLDDIYFCPHIPEDNCLCRKPKVELIEKAVRKHQFDPKLSFVIGDNKSDIELGKNIGATTILVRTGHGAEIEKGNKVNPDFIVDSLKETLLIISDHLKA